MKLITYMQDHYIYIKNRLKGPSAENLIWWINLTPQWAGFSIQNHKNSVLFCVTYITLLFYVSFCGNFVYRLILPEEVNGSIKANANLSIVIVSINFFMWFLTKRSLLISTLEKVKEIDKLSSKYGILYDKYKQLIKKIKFLVLGYYVVHVTNIFLIWMPLRMDLSSSLYSAYPCPGINVTTKINKGICRTIIFIQDTTITIVLVTYHCLFLFFIAHTAAMYILMSEEMKSLNRSEEGRAQVKDRLSLLIGRHVLLLDIVQRLGSLYTKPTGVDFATDAYFVCILLTLSLQYWIIFGSLLAYCFVVFSLYCFHCQKLIDASVEFERSVYACGWENFQLSDKKTVYIVLKFAQRPVKLLAGDIVPIDINTFAATLQFMFKFITALKT